MRTTLRGALARAFCAGSVSFETSGKGMRDMEASGVIALYRGRLG